MRAIAVVFLAAFVACGSTARQQAQPGGRDELSGAPAAEVDAGAGAAATDTSIGGATSPSGAAGGRVSTRATTEPGSTRPGSIPTSGPGWDKSFVYIGVTTQKDVQGAFETVGVSGLDAGDQEAQANAVAAELNRRGGLFGRQIKIVFRDIGTIAAASDPNTVGTAACRYFAEDRRVIALLSPVTLMDVPSFRACMANAKLPLISASVAATDAKVGASLAPYFYQLVAPTWDALAPVLARELQAQGWFGGWDARTGAPVNGKRAKIGIVTATDDVATRVAAVVKKALGTAGDDAVVYQGNDGDYSAAVLQFAGRGVTHVIAVDAALVGFQLSAATQGYRPRYGITSFNAPVSLLEANAPNNQLVGAVGVGWSPSLDVSEARDPGSTGAGEAECTRILAAAGQRYPGKRLAEGVAFAFCDGLRMIAQGAIAGGGLSGVAIFNGVKATAASFTTAFSFASGLSPTRLFVPGAVRRLAYDTNCNCFLYTSTVNQRL